jgi:purine nucleoside phosphorylase
LKLHVITKQLSQKLSPESELQKFTKVNPEKFKSIYNILYSQNINELIITDATCTKKMTAGNTVQVMDHINNTGSSPLIGKQAFLDIDFVDMTGAYTFENNAVITNCCGEKLNKNFTYPSHFLCHITLMARALKIPIIKGFLYNVF